jgi:hypothetical protein
VLKNRIGFAAILAGSSIGIICSSHLRHDLAIAQVKTISIDQQTQQVADYLIGEMDTSAQAIANWDAADVRMSTCIVSVNSLNRSESVAKRGLVASNEAIFLYQEQAISTKLGQPYRQRFLRIAPSADRQQVESITFRPPEHKRWVGLCNQPEQSARSISPQDLGQPLCSVFLSLDPDQPDRYIGNTAAAGCPTNFRGAVKITNQILLSAKAMETWDRGFDAAGKQVWGASDRSYKFKDIDPETQDPHLNQIAAMLSGKFDNAQQQASDPTFLPVRFNNCLVKVKPASLFPTGTQLMVLEQASNSPELQFASQRVAHIYRLPTVGHSFHMITYKLTEGDFADFCDRPVAERVITTDQIGKRECQITYRQSNRQTDGQAIYSGTTPAGGCPSQFRGSTYITIDSQLSDTQIEFWERWYNDNDVQVAGSEQGTYIYQPLDLGTE